MKILPILLGLAVLPAATAELRVPAFTAYLAPDANGARVSREQGVSQWTAQGRTILWFGEFKTTGPVRASVALRWPGTQPLKLRLSQGGQSRDASVAGGGGELRAAFGEFKIDQPGYAKFELEIVEPTASKSGEITALVLEGAPAENAHFNLDPRRNAASVHLAYPTEKDAPIAGFYNEVIAVEDPVASYYMACGFSRGYFGMQVNSPTERRIIFSVWDAGSGQSAKDRSSVDPENQVQLLAKGEGVEAGVFGNEGTGGHSHLVYPWKTGSSQRFFVAAKPDGSHTTYSGWWFHPERGQWMLMARFRAPKDGKHLRGLYSFSENFGGSNGHLRRKALFGPQWIATTDGKWIEITEAKFSHDPTGKAARLDRFMGVEDGKFFLSQGGFIEGFTKYGDPFTRPATGVPPTVPMLEK